MFDRVILKIKRVIFSSSQCRGIWNDNSIYGACHQWNYTGVQWTKQCYL